MPPSVRPCSPVMPKGRQSHWTKPSWRKESEEGEWERKSRKDERLNGLAVKYFNKKGSKRAARQRRKTIKDSITPSDSVKSFQLFLN